MNSSLKQLEQSVSQMVALYGGEEGEPSDIDVDCK